MTIWWPRPLFINYNRDYKTRIKMILNAFYNLRSKSRVIINLNKLLRISLASNQRWASSSHALDFQNEKLQQYLESLRKEFYDLRVNSSGSANDYQRMNQLSDIVKMLEQHRALKGNMASREDIEAEKDEDMRQLIEEENQVYSELMRKTEVELLTKMQILTDSGYYPSLIFEVNAGAGGQEAMLFAKELYDMYLSYFDNCGWDYEVLTEDTTDIGGLRHANVIVNEEEAFKAICYEGGVHRVQRVPATEKSGRIHTSTASVAIIPRPADINVVIAEKDLKIETKRASGAGGQHVNTTDSAVRILHIPTGIAIESQTERSQIKNKEIALKRLKAKLEQIQLESSEASTRATRRAQQGNLDRNEKIRTYNFVQDRITDHRIQGGTVHNLKDFLQGGEHLRSLMQKVAFEIRKKKLVELVESWQIPEEKKA
ncbi:peptide chain release factor 1-like, mitochondrial [Stomoxys calcitrans]|uniref:peptide chain release factor 1-like, mitochondrial n=1 Tax=Stomoxys calcitrans TaxID=35570 RepID=UPI0027E2D107|nr:peptide chain release factor 1-like, mitochondrial [Stomoxys calcitrans]